MYTSIDLHSLLLYPVYIFSDWCAKLYEHDEYKGWEEEVSQTNYGVLSNSHRDAVTSIRVRDGCNFKGYKYSDKSTLIEDLSDDVHHLANNDELRSYSCSCFGKFTINVVVNEKSDFY